MKVNIILPGIGLSGGVKIAFMYAQYLVEKGHDVVCYYPLSGAYSGWKKILFPKMIFLQLTNKKYSAKWFNYSFEIKHPLFINNMSVRDADVTIATFWLTAYWTNKLSVNKGKKCYFIQGYETWGKQRINNRIEKSYSLDFDERIVVSSALRDKLYEKHSITSIVICNGVPEKEVKRTINECSNSIMVIGFPYRESKHKNCGMAIEVLEELEKNYQIYIKSYGLSKPQNWNEQWEFVENPTREELMRFYDSVDVFYIPSLYEGWGLPAMEAMARGCAVIAHNSGVVAEIGKDKENCVILNNAADRKEVSEKLVYLITNKGNINQIGEKARQKIIADYLHEKSCKKFEQTLNNMLD